MGYNKRLISFPCVNKNGKYVNTDICEKCFDKNKCDIYQTMILEQDSEDNDDCED